MTTEKLNIVVRRGLLCLVAAYVLLHLCVTVGWMVSPWVNEYREWAQADAVLQLFHLHGGELYGGPGSTSLYVYGFLFPGLGYLLTLMTGLEPLSLCFALPLMSARLVLRPWRQASFGSAAEVACTRH